VAHPLQEWGEHINLTTMKIFTIIGAILIGFASFAAHTGELRILSQSGERFYVVMDGAYQNYYPQSNVNMQAYANNMFNLKIVSANNQFHFNRNIVVQPNRRLTYRIINNFGNYVLQFQSETPLFNGTNGGQNTCAYNPPPRPYEVSQGQYYNNNNWNAHPMSSADFDNLKRAIQRESFSDDQLRIAKRAAKDRRLSARQIRDITRLFTFSSEQLAFAKTAYRNCVDKHNYYIVMEAFTFSSDKDELEAFIDAQ